MTNNLLKRKFRKPASKHMFGRALTCACLTAFLAFSVYSTVSLEWMINDTSASTIVNGVTIDWIGTPGGKDYKNKDFDDDLYWTDPFNGPFGGGESLEMEFTPFGTDRMITVNFSRPVDNPVLHVERIGDHEKKLVSTTVFRLVSFSSASPNVTVSKLSGNPAFQINTAAKSFQRATGTVKGAGKCKDVIDQGTGCGSVQLNGTGITSLTFAVGWDGADNGKQGDKLEIRWSLGTSVVVRKQSVGTTGTYNFSGTNGIGNFSLNTALSNPADSPRFPIPDNSQNIAITEAAPVGTILTSVTCSDPAVNTVPSNLNNFTATLASSDYFNINQLITCTFVNSLAPPPLVDLLKSCSAPATCETGPQLSATDLTFSIQFTNTGGQSAAAFTVVDEIPDNTDFKLASAAADPGTSGLTFVIEYSADYSPGNPTAATWNYAPVSAGGGAPAGYDRVTKAIRWRTTSGLLPNAPPNNAGDLRFGVRIR